MLRRSASALLPAAVSNLGRLNHIAIAVPKERSLEDAAAVYKNIMGAKVSEPKPQEEHGVITMFVELPNSKIELLHPLGDNSPIANFLERNKSGGIHHVCVETPDIQASIAQLKDQNVRTLGTKTKIGAHGNPVIFLHPKDCGGVLVELEEVKPAAAH